MSAAVLASALATAWGLPTTRAGMAIGHQSSANPLVIHSIMPCPKSSFCCVSCMQASARVLTRNLGNLQFQLQLPTHVTHVVEDLPATLHPAYSRTSETQSACRAQLQQQLWAPRPAPGSASSNEAATLVSLILAVIGAYVDVSWQPGTGTAMALYW